MFFETTMRLKVNQKKLHLDLSYDWDLIFENTKQILVSWWIKPLWGGTAYLTIVEIYQTGLVNFLMGEFRCDYRVWVLRLGKQNVWQNGSNLDWFLLMWCYRISHVFFSLNVHFTNQKKYIFIKMLLQCILNTSVYLRHPACAVCAHSLGFCTLHWSDELHYIICCSELVQFCFIFLCYR